MNIASVFERWSLGEMGNFKLLFWSWNTSFQEISTTPGTLVEHSQRGQAPPLALKVRRTLNFDRWLWRAIDGRCSSSDTELCGIILRVAEFRL